jgi:prepilin-type N-terminal cleavage/methylation domain-containing protein
MKRPQHRPQRPANPLCDTHYALRRAFTLIELLVVIAIMAILAATTLPMIPAVNDQARIGTCESRLQQIGIALRLYAEDYHAYPKSLRALYAGRYVEQQSLLRCDKAGKEYYYRPAALNAARETVLAACTDPTTPSGSRPHSHHTLTVALHAHGGTSRLK